MLKAVLFDLDNTLIHFSERMFFESYLSKVPKAFADIMPRDVFVGKLLSSTQALMRNNGEMLNVDYFMNLFSAGYEERRSELWSRFMTFYETEYDQFKAIMSRSHGVQEVILRLKENGVKIVIASNPIWPLNVQMKRLSWAGLEDIEFDLVTHIGNMSYCKPHIEYYQEVCQRIDEGPEVCLMVGNDPVNDMVVSKIGMRTYLVTEGATDESALELSRSVRIETPGEIPEPDFKGPLSRVPDAVEALLGKNRG
ncbi:MAG: HAD family hydrolase [Dehalococcoidia bacterium]|nr:MAG: HAD family hydrolase [Dehalococcoidia bacterium]